MTTTIKVITLHGRDILPFLPEVAKLRMTVFREYPYLYDGDLTYEQDYLQTYADSANSLIVLALDNNRVIGASTGIPMPDAEEAVQKEFLAGSYTVKDWFYYGESVLLPAYRGHGLGVRFFEEREHFARALNCKFAAFCAVVRPHDHSQKPPNYVALTSFWQHRGYVPLSLACYLSWKEVGAESETSHLLAFWFKELTVSTNT